MLSKLIRQKIEEKFGHQLRYSKQCDALAAHIQEVCKMAISASTLCRLLGFVKNSAQPREYSLDILAAYIGHHSWGHLLRTLEKGGEETEKIIASLRPEQVRKGQTVLLAYEPGKKIELKKEGTAFLVVTSNEKKLLPNDTVTFQVIELHYPLTLTNLFREGNGLGRLQLATVSGVTAIKKG
jgi:hypothetical protein